MELFISFVLLALGFVMLVKGADFFVDGASSIAGGLGIPQLVIGLTVVAMGTSAPEAAVSLTAAIKGNADITLGNIVGSNILNVLIIYRRYCSHSRDKNGGAGRSAIYGGYHAFTAFVRRRRNGGTYRRDNIVGGVRTLSYISVYYG